MRAEFTPSQLYNRLPYGTTIPSHCPNLPVLSFDCRVDPKWIEQNLKNTPFLPAGDRIVITSADYSNNSVVSFKDVMVMLPIEYMGGRGGHPIIEFEDTNRLVMGGREKWGCPKLVSQITFDRTEKGGIKSVVTLGASPVIELEWEPEETVLTEEPLKLTLHYLLRVLPSASKPGIDFAEILTRDSSPDTRLLVQKTGRGSVKFTDPWTDRELDYCNLVNLEIKEIVSATLTTYDWRLTEENGWGRLVERLV